MGAHSLLVLGGIALPSLLWVGYFHWKDRAAPEPLARLGIAYLLGVGASLLALVLETAAQEAFAEWFPLVDPEANRGAFFLHCLLVVGVVEETLKMIPFALVCVRFRDFDEPSDGVVYAASVGIGFSVYETLLHLELLRGFEVVGRTVTAPLVHGLFCAIWGNAWARYKVTGAGWWVPLGAWAASALIHGVYDFLVLSMDSLLRPASAVLIFGCWFWMARHMKRHAEAHKRRRPQAPDPVN